MQPAGSGAHRVPLPQNRPTLTDAPDDPERATVFVRAAALVAAAWSRALSTVTMLGQSTRGQAEIRSVFRLIRFWRVTLTSAKAARACAA